MLVLYTAHAFAAVVALGYAMRIVCVLLYPFPIPSGVYMVLFVGDQAIDPNESFEHSR